MDSFVANARNVCRPFCRTSITTSPAFVGRTDRESRARSAINDDNQLLPSSAVSKFSPSPSTEMATMTSRDVERIPTVWPAA